MNGSSIYYCLIVWIIIDVYGSVSCLLEIVAIHFFQAGEIDLKEYDHYLAETEILPELVTIRGLIRKRFPTVRSGK